VVDYSLAGMQKLFNSSRDIGDEAYNYVADTLNIDIYIFRGTTDDLFSVATTAKERPRNYSIVLLGVENHYELVGVLTTQGERRLIQTVFEETDYFLTVVRANFGL